MRLAVLIAAAFLCAAAPVAAQSSKRVDFKTEVWPVFRKRCIRCHGAEKQDGGLRLDSLSGLRAGGNTGLPMVGPNSQIVKRITLGVFASGRMPSGEKSLPPEQIAAIKGWSQQGAEWSLPEDKPAGWFSTLTDHAIEIFSAVAAVGVLVLILVIVQKKRQHRPRDANR